MKATIDTKNICRNFVRKMSGEEGLTLIEIMVSMMIFLVISVGVAGTMTSGLRTTVENKLATMGKDVAQEQMEEMRARAYYIPYSADPNVGTTADIDLLDKYYPDLSTSTSMDAQGWTGHYTSGSNAHYTTVSPPDAAGIVRTVETWFVDSNRNVIVPASSYNSNSTSSDKPPSELVQVRVTTSWPDLNGQGSYALDSLISSTGQSIGTGESGCVHASNSRVDVTGGIFIAANGTLDPLTVQVDAKLGDAHAVAAYGCTPTLQASATGGKFTLLGGLEGGNVFLGATATVNGPPEQELAVGPLNLDLSGIWPLPAILNSRVEAEIEDEDGAFEVEAEGKANVGTQWLQVNEVSGVPLDLFLTGYKRWDFVNPTLYAVGAGSGDDGEDIEAEIEQEDGVTEGEAEVGYQQINLLPLQKWPPTVLTYPSAVQGLVFVRNFRAEAHSRANGSPGGASNSTTYSATVGLFNPNKSGCTTLSTGDSCYDLYAISPSNPIQNIDLTNANYALQNALMTEWHSFTSTELSSAMYASADGKNASIAIDALLKITAKYGEEVRWSTSDGSVSLMNQYGIQQLWLGAIDISVEQNG